MAKSVATSGAGSAAAPARALAPHARVELSLAGSATAEMACATISDMFHVGRAEVALLRAENDVLNFLFPAELKAAGCEKIYREKASGGRWDRPELHRLLDHLRKGDAASVYRGYRTGFV